MNFERDKIIQVYFNLGLEYRDIVHALGMYHGIILSERHIKRILKSMGLFRRKNYSDLIHIVTFIEQQLKESGKQHGYRWMTQKCHMDGLKCKQEEVRIILHALDPEGVELRKGRRLRRRSYIAKGPNFIWHFDSYDKLKRFGFCINGCVDGFSRKIIWLNSYVTSNDPRVIGGYYLEAVSSAEGCPLVVRGDQGTENGHVRQLQRLFRRNGNDERAGDKSYLEGRSTANQRIEYFWNFLRRQCTEFWISHFQDIERDGNFDGGFLDVSLLQYCYMHLVQEVIQETIVPLHVKLNSGAGGDESLFIVVCYGHGHSTTSMLDANGKPEFQRKKTTDTRSVSTKLTHSQPIGTLEFPLGDLDDVVVTWNHHRIRPVNKSRNPSGRPATLYLLPEIVGARDYLCPVPHAEIEGVENECIFRKPIACDEDVFELCSTIMAEERLSYPNSAVEALELYLSLREAATNFLN